VVIDARGIELKEVYIRLKEILASKLGAEVFIEIRLGTLNDTRSVKAFVSMTGCKTEVREEEGYYVVVIKGSPCCV